MSANADSTFGRSKLRAELRTARALAGLSQRQVAEALGWSASKVFRIESGQVGISRTDLKALLGLYRIVDPEKVAHFAQLAQDGKRLAFREYRDVLNTEFMTYLGFEAVASRLSKFDLVFIPGLLQTEAYARKVIWDLASPHTSPTVLGRQLAVRLARQQHLESDEGPDAHFVIDQAAVSRRFKAGRADPQIMLAQLDHLRIVAERPSVTLQILPFGAGVQYGMLGSFNMLGFEDESEDDVVFVENSGHSLVIRDRIDQVQHYRTVFARLSEMACSPTESLHLLSALSRRLRD